MLFAPILVPTIPQVALATGQVKNKCSIFSSAEQKKQAGLPDQFLLIILSLVKMTPFSTSHIKTLIPCGILEDQICEKVWPESVEVIMS
jgi:hypothetical protein